MFLREGDFEVDFRIKSRFGGTLRSDFGSEGGVTRNRRRE